MLGEGLWSGDPCQGADKKNRPCDPSVHAVSTSLLQSNDSHWWVRVVEVNDYVLNSETLHTFHPHVVRRADLFQTTLSPGLACRTDKFRRLYSPFVSTLPLLLKGPPATSIISLDRLFLSSKFRLTIGQRL